MLHALLCRGRRIRSLYSFLTNLDLQLFLGEEYFDFGDLEFSRFHNNLVKLLSKDEIFACGLEQFGVELQLFCVRLHLYVHKVSHDLPLVFQLLYF